jgi:hypothetical protein
MKNRWKQFSYIMAHRDEEIDIDDRETLAAIEARLTGDVTGEEIATICSTISKEGQ